MCIKRLFNEFFSTRYSRILLFFELVCMENVFMELVPNKQQTSKSYTWLDKNDCLAIWLKQEEQSASLSLTCQHDERIERVEQIPSLLNGVPEARWFQKKWNSNWSEEFEGKESALALPVCVANSTVSLLTITTSSRNKVLLSQQPNGLEFKPWNTDVQKSIFKLCCLTENVYNILWLISWMLPFWIIISSLTLCKPELGARD